MLDRLSRRSEGPASPSRTELVTEFCRATDWRDGKGRLSLSSARVALRKLEQAGRVRLPPMAPRNPRVRARGLFDDGQPLPGLPKLPTRGPITGLRVRLIQDEHDPAHRIWNRLIAREHPLGRRPLVGAQLRYLVECDLGMVGAFGFGPPAFHLACRDQWIGWGIAARAQNRGRVIGLSRFLLRPGLRAPNLASQCYGLVLRQVGPDWQERYGVRPELVETYVDRTSHRGQSLAAANWRRLGRSAGRGRDDPRRQQSQSPKDVWVYELDPQARRHLQAQPVERLAPNSASHFGTLGRVGSTPQVEEKGSQFILLLYRQACHHSHQFGQAHGVSLASIQEPASGCVPLPAPGSPFVQGRTALRAGGIELPFPARICKRNSASRFESGSSINNTAACITIARATATRCRCPPDNCAG